VGIFPHPAFWMVPNWEVRVEQSTGAKLSVKSNQTSTINHQPSTISHRWPMGKGKTGTVNVSESVLTPRYA